MASFAGLGKLGCCAVMLLAAALVSAGAASAGGDASLSDRRASELLQAADAELALGQSWSGQRLLEMLVARYPDSPEAQVARGRLFALYGQSLVPSEPASAVSIDRRGWRTDALVVSARQEDLRLEVGDRVFFSDGSAALGGPAKQVIAAQALWLSRHPELIIEVEGHADDRRGQIDQEGVALARAAAVRAALVQAGVDAARVGVRSFGAAARVAVCEAPDCAAQNRRAVVILSEIATGDPALAEATAARVARR